MEATKASSGSTFAGFENGIRTAAGEGDAGTVRPPSNIQLCSREYVPFRKSPCVCVHWIRALCSDIEVQVSTRFKLAIGSFYQKWFDLHSLAIQTSATFDLAHAS